MSVKTVKTLAISGAADLKVVSGSVASGDQSEAINTTTLDDAKMTKVRRFQTEYTDITLLCEYAGTLATVGTLATLTVTALDSGASSNAAARYGFIKSAIPQEVSVDGERRMLQQIVFTPTGTAAP